MENKWLLYFLLELRHCACIDGWLEVYQRNTIPIMPVTINDNGVTLFIKVMI